MMDACSCDICLDVWGDFAVFTMPDAKVERVSYDVPTPSACRGILNAIYSKPIEFYYEITQIEVMNPIKKIQIKRNEVVRKADSKKLDSIYVEEDRTQRGTEFLKDVYYRIHAKMIVREDAPNKVTISSVYSQFMKRLTHGKCFYQPYLGAKECIAFFSLPDPDRKPLNLSKDYGIMLYDIFDITKNVPIDTSSKKGIANSSKKVTYYRAVMNAGVISVPSYEDVRKGVC